jgi:uncharacterized protein (TIGR02246 family)
MTIGFASPQDAEDAFYDAIDEGAFDTLEALWDPSEEVFSLVPMGAASIGRNAVLTSWQPLFQGGSQIEIEVGHLLWIETAEIAIHLVEERVKVRGQAEQQPPVYATNVYRKREGGWHLIIHQNSPTPPPPGMLPPQMRMP